MTTYFKSFAQGLIEAQQHSDPRDAQGDTQSQSDGVMLVKGSDLEPRSIEWLWVHWLAVGKLHILAGAPGQGKTTLALSFAACVTSGGRWPDGTQCEIGNVLIWSGEDDARDTLVPRLIAMGADMSRIFFVTGARIDGEILAFDPARDLAELTAAAQREGNIKLVLVDPVVSAVTGDSHKNTEVRRSLQPLVDLAANLNAALLGISHLAKGGAGKDPTERVVGSIAFSAVARVVMIAAKLRSDLGIDRRVLARSKSNIGPDDCGFEYALNQVELETHPGLFASRVEWGEAVEGCSRDLLANSETDSTNADHDRSATADAKDALIRVLKRDTVPGREAQKQMRALGFSEKVIRRARESVGVVIVRSGFGAETTTYWKLPDRAVVPTDD